MTLINATMLTGMILAVVPIVLHLVMRARPRRIEFPALRLLRTRQPSNARRMKLRHWLLLMLRAGLIAVAVLAIARPSLPAAKYGLRWWEWVILGATAAAAFGVYRWLCRRDSGLPDSAALREARTRRRTWCVSGGALLALLAAGLPWGMRVRGELLAPRNEAMENIPVAAVFLFDTSISMTLRHENRTRLDQARDVAGDYLSHLPTGSRVAIAGLSPDEEVVFQADLTGAQSRMEALQPTAVPQSLNSILKSAIQSLIDDRRRLQEETGVSEGEDLFAREILVFTDLSPTAWAQPDESGLADLVAQHEWLQIYVVNVGVAQPRNVSFSGLRLSEETSVPGREVLLSVTVAASSAVDTAAAVEVFRLDSGGREIRLGAARNVRTEAGPTELQLTLEMPAGQPFVEGFVRLSGADPLPDDSIRYFTIAVRPKPRLLFVAESAAESFFLRNALQPEGAAAVGLEFYECRSIRLSQFSQQTLSDYDVICVINCREPDVAFWSALRKFAESGGGVFFGLGSLQISPEHWTAGDSRQILPAIPISPVKYLKEPAQLTVVSDKDVVGRAFARWEEARTELSRALFDRCWAVEPDPQGEVLMRFSGPGNRPALLARRVGAGRCLMFASALDNLPNGGSSWNNFVVENWAFLVWSDLIMQHLTGASDQTRNYVSGQAVELPVPGSQRFSQFLLRRPDLRNTKGELSPEHASLLIADAFDAGHYRVRPFESGSPFESAFAVNIRDEEGDLSRIAEEKLQEILGKQRFTFVDRPDELSQAVRVGRLGVEVFPVLMGVLVVIFCGEHLMANFFYDER